MMGDDALEIVCGIINNIKKQGRVAFFLLAGGSEREELEIKEDNCLGLNFWTIGPSS